MCGGTPSEQVDQRALLSCRAWRRSTEIGLRSSLESVLDADLDAGVDVQLVQTVGFDPVHLLGLAARRELAADGAGAEVDRTRSCRHPR